MPDDAIWVDDPRQSHALSFRHEKGELPDNWFFCPRCDRIYPASQWTKECPGRAMKASSSERSDA